MHLTAMGQLWVIVAPYKIKKEGYLLRNCPFGAMGMALFIVEQVFFLMG